MKPSVHFDSLPESITKKWQAITDLLAEMRAVPAALIMRTDHEVMEVFVNK